MSRAEEQARHYLLNEHSSPLTSIMHEADLKAEMQYHKDIENGYIKGYEQAIKNALQWLTEHLKNYIDYNKDGSIGNFDDDALLEGFDRALM